MVAPLSSTVEGLDRDLTLRPAQLPPSDRVGETSLIWLSHGSKKGSCESSDAALLAMNGADSAGPDPPPITTVVSCLCLAESQR